MSRAASASDAPQSEMAAPIVANTLGDVNNNNNMGYYIT